MAVLRLLISCVICAGVAGKADKATAKEITSPLVSTDILYGTYELIQDLTSVLYTKSNIDGVLTKIPYDDVVKAVNEQAKQIPPEVWEIKAKAEIAYFQVKATATVAVGNALEHANTAAVRLIESCEAKFPNFKGLVKKTLGNLILFVCYIMFVAWLAAKIVLFAIRTVVAIVSFFLCGICCCRLCRSSKPRAKAPTNGKPTAAVAKPASGKTTTTKSGGKKK